MIRKWDTEDTAPLLALWLDSTIHAHPFISESYWRDSVAVVRDVYLPAASTWVWEQDGELKGFVSVLDSRFVGALFVAPGATRQGIGRALLDEVKQHYAWLSLEVYQKNESAVSFYHAQGFRIDFGDNQRNIGFHTKSAGVINDHGAGFNSCRGKTFGNRAAC